MLVLTLVSIALALTSLLLGVSVIIRNNRDPVHRVFFAVCLCAALWTAVFEWTYLIYFSPPTSTGLELLRILNRSSLFLGLATMYCTVLFTFYFPLERDKKLIKLFTPLLVVVAVLCATRAVAGRMSVVGEHYQNPPGRLIWLYLITMGIGVLIIAYNLVRRRRALSGLQRAQQRLVAISLISSLIAGVALGVVAPIFFPESKIDSLSPMALLLFLAPVANAIRNYRLFDFRAVMVRSLAYVLVLAVLSAIFIVTGLLASVIFTNSITSLGSGAAMTFFAISIILAVSFSPLKKFFDKITSNLFYRDAYDSQELLNNLNRSLITTIDLEGLLNKSAAIVGDSLRVEFCGFAIKDYENRGLRLFGSVGRRVDEQSILKIAAAAVHITPRLVIADELDTAHAHLRELMQAAGMAAFVRLEGHTKGKIQHPGYIVLGSKRSGAIYTPQDTAVLQIIAGELVIAIQNSLRFEEIQHFNITLREKIEEATKQLRHANRRLRELDATKDEFISMASHQLRTPLTTIKGYLSMVLEGDAGPVRKEQKTMIRQAFESAERMVFLIGDLLNVSRLQSGKFVIDNKPTDLAAMVEAEIKQLQESALNHHLTLNFHKPQNFPILNLDETKIRQVVMNFLDNAIYYTPPGGSIEVKLESTPDSVAYTVTDTGLGVPKEEQHHLFSKFYRAANARKMRPDGTGLGLFMAKKVIVAQGGAVIFRSTEGKGSTFGFSFPRASVEAKGKAPEESKQLESALV